MAYMAVVTKQSVSKASGSNDFIVTIHVVIDDGVDVVLEKDYSQTYNSNTNIADIKDKLQDDLVADWEVFLSEKVIYNAAQFTTLVNQINTAANAYINS